MKLSRVAVIAVSVLALLAGGWLGLLPIKATMTQISPVLRQMSVSCGNGYLGSSLPVHPGGLVEIPGEHAVYLPKAAYDTHCGEAVGPRRYAAWGLTALGVLGLAMTFAAARTPASSGSSAGSSSRSSGSSESSGSPEPDEAPEAPVSSESSDAPESSEVSTSSEAESATSGSSESSKPSGRSKGGAHRA